MEKQFALENPSQQKQIQAIIESVLMTNPDLKDRITVAAVWTYLQMEDSCFGWGDTKITPEIKKLVVLNCLRFGAIPGMGHIYWLGNKLYCSASFLRNKAAADPEWIVKRSEFLPFTDQEKECFGILKGDLCVKVVKVIEYRGTTITAEGHGIVGGDEHPKKPGLGSRKDKAMTLKTRAERDLLKREYPIEVPEDLSSEESQHIYDVEVIPNKTKERLVGGKIHQVVKEDKEKANYIDMLQKKVEEKSKQENVPFNFIIDMMGLRLDFEKNFCDFSLERICEVIQAVEDFQLAEEPEAAVVEPKPVSDSSPKKSNSEGEEKGSVEVWQKEIGIIQNLIKIPPISGDEKLTAFVKKFTTKRLKKSDAQKIVTGVSKASQGDYTELEKILLNRKNI